MASSPQKEHGSIIGAVTHEDHADLSRARRLVMAYGWNTTAYQILNPGFAYWFAPDGTAVVAYIQRQHVMLVAGAPVCPVETLAVAVAGFEQFARDHGCRVCYVCAAERMRKAMDRTGGHATIVIGAQPVWDPRHWSIARTRRSIRYQLARARNKGVTVETLAAARARNDPEIERVLNQWLRSRCLPPMRFLVEPHTLDGVLTDRLVLAARQHGSMVAFLVASPIAARNGFLIEQVARSPRAPNGSSELLIDAAMRYFAAAGCSYATLGLVALSNNAPGASTASPWWFKLMTTFARAHANRFYNFRGLERFRIKLAPAHWETIFAISNEQRFSMRTLYAVGEAFAGISPWMALGLGVYRALGNECARLRNRWGLAIS